MTTVIDGHLPRPATLRHIGFGYFDLSARLQRYGQYVVSTCPTPPCSLTRWYAITGWEEIFAHNGDPDPEHWLRIPDIVQARPRTERWLVLRTLRWLRKLHNWERRGRPDAAA